MYYGQRARLSDVGASSRNLFWPFLHHLNSDIETPWRKREGGRGNVLLDSCCDLVKKTELPTGVGFPKLSYQGFVRSCTLHWQSDSISIPNKTVIPNPHLLFLSYEEPGRGRGLASPSTFLPRRSTFLQPHSANRLLHLERRCSAGHTRTEKVLFFLP